MRNLKFSGHETFIARGFWPKKGYDYISQGNQFNAPDAVVKLGVGKNMVNSIQFWTSALDIYDKEKDTFTELANYIFGENGVDPYLEDIGSLWLLHYSLVKTNYSSIYHQVFNKFRKERTSFTKDHLKNFIKRVYTEEGNSGFNETTVGKDIDVFRRLYNTPDYRTLKKDFEDEINGLFIELGLLSTAKEAVGAGKDKISKEWFYLTPSIRKNLPVEIVLFQILDHFEGFSNISFTKLENEENGPGLVFLLNKDGLYKQLQTLENNYDEITISETAGNISLTITGDIDKWNILNEYYGN